MAELHVDLGDQSLGERIDEVVAKVDGSIELTLAAAQMAITFSGLLNHDNLSYMGIPAETLVPQKSIGGETAFAKIKDPDTTGTLDLGEVLSEDQLTFLPAAKIIVGFMHKAAPRPVMSRRIGASDRRAH